ncbi:dTDP-4-dehydrorhamnose reductase [Oceanirhabdus seepicola]|uniref:dTDP-4-dehydrorhamnose reductase n=1 Tax=Oceanirhabdus seepicola TaxID=2828781 RepID=A0A9J6NXQ3_9CLOT|nr:dTDP-4-dehydrorhamnose reductase [Oceanirhabdus seepicola]MCM1989287.1 dTDP-4-dehydrorhamnose reductase [Oceanirhabdus seepicola]
MKILITGDKGQLGSQVLDILYKGVSELGKIHDIYINSEILGTDKKELDITSLERVRKLLQHFKPDVLINTSAYTNVDGCESNKDLAFKVNALGARNLAIVCEEIGAKLIHVSTDYVFDGRYSIPQREYDLPNPISIYGKTKYLGEEYIKQFCTKYFIVRTAWLYGYNGKNFVKTIIKAAKEKRYLEVVDDQKGNPTNAEDLAYHILKIALTDEYGIYHCTGKGQCSWYDFACRIVEYAGMDCHVKPIKSNEIKRAAKRPANSSLDNMMLRCIVGDETREWEEALAEFIHNYK